MVTRAGEFTQLDVGEVRLGAWHWRGDGPTVVFTHAAGFHSRVWDETIKHLEGFDCWALDMRGHGQSDKPEPPYFWNNFVEDTARAVELLNIKNALGVGHSMGGHSIAGAAAKASDRFAALMRIDPIILEPGVYEVPARIGHTVSHRRNEWTSAEQMFDRFKNIKPFVTWNRQVLRDYCQFGLVANEAGNGFVLACPPHVEQSIYDHANHASANIHAAIRALTIPVEVLTPGSPEKIVAPDLEKYFSRGYKTALPDQSHFIPM